ncbi:hypothetical protein [Massilia sp. ST3]|uniref:hypothetical protein n=1 Tax=Massilia sp. ST3 TaxID=2824903 RepID=UPI001B828E0D|nr:hypothetical protein [Massilia sp. ST3]MBQ5946701.1 hypothetical protein [Massilia sp. ST3]
MKHLGVTTLLGLACAAAHAAPDSSQPSRTIGEVSASVVGGSVLLAAAGGSLVVESVRASGDGVDLVLRNAADASVATVRLSSKAAGALSLGAGTVIEVLSSSAGQLLVLSGKAIAFIPNEAGKALLHHERAY